MMVPGCDEGAKRGGGVALSNASHRQLMKKTIDDSS
jgi:hypothetical protein